MHEPKEIEHCVKKMVADFQEQHLDTNVRVFVNYTQKGKGYCFSWGGGDWFAQLGHVLEWTVMQKERTRLQFREGEREEEGGISSY